MNDSQFLTMKECQEKKAFYIYYLETILYLFPTVITVSCILAVFSNFTLVFILFRESQIRRFVSKRLLLVTNRCVVDLVTAFVSGLYLLGVSIECDMLDCRSESIIPDVIVEFVLTLNFWILACTYIGTSLLTFYSVKEPLKHHYHGHMEYWMVDLCGTFINEALTSANLLNMIFPVLNYIITFSGYLLVACTLYCRRNDPGIPRRHHAAICRLGVHFIIFTLGFILMAMAYWSIYPMIKSCRSWSEKLTSAKETENFTECDTDHLRAFLVYGITTFLSGAGWFIRMTVDTVIDFSSDHQLRRSLSCDQRKRDQERVNNYALCERRNSSTRSHSTAN